MRAPATCPSAKRLMFPSTFPSMASAPACPNPNSKTPSPAMLFSRATKTQWWSYKATARKATTAPQTPQPPPPALQVHTTTSAMQLPLSAALLARKDPTAHWLPSFPLLAQLAATSTAWAPSSSRIALSVPLPITVRLVPSIPPIAQQALTTLLSIRPVSTRALPVRPVSTVLWPLLIQLPVQLELTGARQMLLSRATVLLVLRATTAPSGLSIPPTALLVPTILQQMRPASTLASRVPLGSTVLWPQLTQLPALLALTAAPRMPPSRATALAVRPETTAPSSRSIRRIAPLERTIQPSINLVSTRASPAQRVNSAPLQPLHPLPAQLEPTEAQQTQPSRATVPAAHQEITVPFNPSIPPIALRVPTTQQSMAPASTPASPVQPVNSAPWRPPPRRRALQAHIEARQTPLSRVTVPAVRLETTVHSSQSIQPTVRLVPIIQQKMDQATYQ